MTAPPLEIGFEGYFMCRLATDPDPNDEPRGRSGYTMALASERPLDQVIRLQPDEYVVSHLRRPAALLNRNVGVFVRSVRLGGDPWPGAQHLVGAAVSLGGIDEHFDGPIFESRNNIVGSDDTLAFVINPFELQIEQPVELGAPIALRAVDVLDPEHPEREIWEIQDPKVYGRRLPSRFDSLSEEVQRAISVFDAYAYFRGRRAFLQQEIERLERQLSGAAAANPATVQLAIEEARSRLYQLEFWGDRVINKLGFRLEWQFDINGKQTVTDGALGGDVDPGRPWNVRIWFGGWDGDLLIGYTRGVLSVPLLPARN